MGRKEPEPFVDVQLRDRIEREIAEHEVFMSFTNDDDAEQFTYWWEEEGAIHFQDWLNRVS